MTPRLYYDHSGIQIWHGDCRDVLPTLEAPSVVIADPPYGETSLTWDSRVGGWVELLKGNCLWCFGSLRFFMGASLPTWTYCQEVIWEKHNGASITTDRFRRVHEIAVQFYRGEWGDVFKQSVYTMDALKLNVKRKTKPQHWGGIGNSTYQSVEGGPRLMRSVLRVRSTHGYAEHPTQKPIGIIAPLIEYSSPAGGLVLDPFMGSGTTLRAAKDLGRRAIGIEIEERYCEIAARRLSQEVLAL